MLKAETVQAIVNYLQTKPYAEVFRLISQIMAEAKSDEQKPSDGASE